MSKPFVSIIIPVYNASKYLRRCFDSIRMQTYGDFEVIAVDDASSDASAAIIKEYTECDGRFRGGYNADNQGTMCTREAGYMQASGEYITFVDADDFLPADALEQMVQEVRTTRADIACFTMAQHDGMHAVHESSYDSEGVFSKHEICKRTLTDKIPHSLWGKIYHSSLFRSLPPATPHRTNAEDMMLFYQLIAKADRIAVRNILSYYYFSNPVSATKSRFTKHIFDHLIDSVNYRYRLFCDDDALHPLVVKKSMAVLESLLRKNIPESSLSILDESLRQEVYSALQNFGLRGMAIRAMLRWPSVRRIISKLKPG